jgi:hypothetical protein
MENELILALEDEMKRIKASGMDVEDSELTIEYLKTGVLPVSEDEIEDYPILESAVYDLEQLKKDYK